MKRTTAAEELTARRNARSGLLAFTEYTHPLWQSGAHHKLICEKLEAVERGEIKRLMIFAPPRHSKSELASKRFVAWYMGRHPDHHIIGCSHTARLADDVGADVRDLISDPDYQNIFPGVTLNQDSKAAYRWRTTQGGIYVSVGVDSAVAGRGAHIAVIDDPISGRNEAESARMREVTWRWYLGDLYQRLMPGGAIVFMMCMTGETPVLMHDGQQKLLRDVRVGDRVATCDNGKMVESVVLNWANKGPDLVYRIKTSSGIVVKANGRHPFLVDRKGGPEWVRLKNLRVGDGILRDIGENGVGLSAAQTAVRIQQNAKDYAHRTTIKSSGPTDIDRRQLTHALCEQPASNTVTALPSKIMSALLRSKKDYAQYAACLLEKTSALIGVPSFALTTATIQGGFVGSCATTATLRSVMGKQRSSCEPLPTISDFGPDRIVEIIEAGREDVFDIQVDRTENFIANGLVSHNTRWHQSDLAARALESEAWDVLELPGIAHEGTDHEEALWPEWWPLDVLQEKRKVMLDGGRIREWHAQYQQRPTVEEGDYIKREWFQNRWDYDTLPKDYNVYMASDFAVTESKEGRDPDYTEHGVFAVGPDSDLFVLDWWSGRTTADVWIESLLDLVAKYKPVAWFGEAGVIRRSVEPFLVKRMRERSVYFHKVWVPSVKDKSIRGRAFQARASMGKVILPKTPWAEEIVSQCAAFPGSTHDDKFDTLSLMALVVDDAHPAVVRSQPVTRPRDSWREAKTSRSSESWKTA